MKKALCRLRKTIFAVSISFAIIFSNSGYSISAATTYYNQITTETIAKGLTYEKSQRVTDEGLLDVHVLRVELDSPNISISTVKSQTEYGLKETTSKILTDNGAIAGINGDFFGLADNYSIPIGLEIANNEILSIGEASNIDGNKNATFFMDVQNSPFINYVNAELHFMNDGVENIKVAAVNKVYDLAVPCFITRQAMETTADLDARINGSMKIVVEDGIITYISQKNETVEIPENGYIVAMNWQQADELWPLFHVGQTAEMLVTTSIDLSTVDNAITGAGKILSNGQLANDGGYVPSGRQPRTAIGISEDKREVILMVVDGRTHSIGANQTEMADLMLEFGAYEAMHLDGGGSSTMVIKRPEDNWPEVVNTLSDGSQRRVINTLGVFNNAPIGDIIDIGIKTNSNSVSNGSYLDVEVYGLDKYLNKIEIPQENIVLTTSDNSGTYSEGRFVPNRTGKIQLVATYGGLTGTKEINSTSLAELIANTKEIKTYNGGISWLSFTGLSTDGEEVIVDSKSVVYEVYPPELGIIENGVFTSNINGTGWIKSSIGDITTYTSVYSTLYPDVITDFQTSPYSVTGESYPDNFDTYASYVSVEQEVGVSAVELSYSFNISDETQAAYAVFDEPIAVPANPYALRLWVNGDNSGHWLRAKIIDSDDKTHLVDFTKSIDWEGWKEVEGYIPVDVKYPISIERLYAVTTQQDVESKNTIVFDYINGMYEMETEIPYTPNDTKFLDVMAYSAENVPQSQGDITFMSTAYLNANKRPNNYNELRGKAIQNLTTNATGIYMGRESLTTSAGNPIKYNGGYDASTMENALLISLDSSKGGLVQSNVYQWSNIKNDIESSGVNNIIIYTDISPYNFKQKQEFELLHNLLKETRDKGKNVFLISNQGPTNNYTVKDGVRYLNVGQMFKEDGSINELYSILRFKINGDDIKYAFEKVNF